MISVSVNSAEVQALARVLDGNAKQLQRQIHIAVNKTATNAQKRMAKEVGKELAVTQKVIRKTISVKRAKVGVSPSATVTLKETARIPLKDFGARQTKKGVSFKVSKSKGRSVMQRAFIVQQYGGNVYRRRNKTRAVGKAKEGLSPWGVFVVNNLDLPQVKFSRADLLKQIKERTRFLGLKKSGAI